MSKNDALFARQADPLGNALRRSTKPLFVLADPTEYPEGIRADLLNAVREGNLIGRMELRSSGWRYRRPVRPMIRREARAILVRLGVIVEPEQLREAA